MELYGQGIEVKTVEFNITESLKGVVDKATRYFVKEHNL